MGALKYPPALLLGRVSVSPALESICSKPRGVVMVDRELQAAQEAAREEDPLARDRALRAAGLVHECGDC